MTETLNRKGIVAVSAPWLAALLNVIPGLGAGYIYQRRWRAYWIALTLAGLWLGADALADLPWTDPLEPWNPFPGLLGLSGFTAAESFLAGRRARMD